MREIKFRVWNRLDGLVYNFVSLCEYNGDWFASFGDGTCEGKVGDDVVLLQYTGLKDKNGVEIYEGDILSEPVSPVGGKDGGYLFKPREVKWKGAGYGYSLFAPRAASEVIGNIYENPELLEDV